MSNKSAFRSLGESFKHRIDFSKTYKIKKGMAINIGNAIRRTILGQVSGYAIRNIEFENVKHQFSSISGMSESVESLIMNLRKLIFKPLDTNNEKGYAFLEIKNIEGEVTAELVRSEDFQIINKDLYICTLTKDVDLKLKMYIEKGIGHILASNVSTKENDQVIVCDSFFSPIENVNFSVESIENNLSEENLFLSITTNGSLTPEDALEQAIITWRDELAKISCKMIEPASDMPLDYIGGSKPLKVYNAYLDSKVKSIPDVSARIASCLDSLNIEYVGQLVKMTEDDLLAKPNFGKGSLKDLSRILSNIGLSLGMKLDDWECPDGIEEESVLIG